MAYPSIIAAFDTTKASIEKHEINFDDVENTVWYEFRVPADTDCVFIRVLSYNQPEMMFALYSGPSLEAMCKGKHPKFKQLQLVAEGAELQCVPVEADTAYYLQVDGEIACGTLSVFRQSSLSGGNSEGMVLASKAQHVLEPLR
jgi:hypothetical protein